MGSGLDCVSKGGARSPCREMGKAGLAEPQGLIRYKESYYRKGHRAVDPLCQHTPPTNLAAF